MISASNLKPVVHVACATGVIALSGVLMFLEDKGLKASRLYKYLRWVQYACAVGVFLLG